MRKKNMEIGNEENTIDILKEIGGK